MKQKKSIGERIMRFLTLILFIGTVGYVAFRYLEYNSDHEDIKIADTPINVLDIKPTGKLYVYTTEVEDYYTDVYEDVNIFSRDYLKCVQILRQQISWVVDLNKVVYEQIPGSDSVHITLPSLEYELSNHGSWFYHQGKENENYNASQLIDIVKKKIKNKYYKREYEEKASQKAREVIGSFVRRCNKEPIFDKKIQRLWERF